ncbi:MAG: hypothetical protein AAF449_17490 [Myxococcota bacterium]
MRAINFSDFSGERGLYFVVARCGRQDLSDRVALGGRMKVSWIMVIIVVLSVPSLASANPRTHDGFFARLSLGGGYTTYKAEDAVVEATIDGGALASSLDIGGTIAQDLVLYGRFASNSIFEPGVDVGGVTTEVQDTVLSLRSVSLGISYYLMPANVALTIGAGLALAEVEVRDPDSSLRIDVNSDPGGYAFIGVSKEWWVGDEWGLGLGIQGSFARIPTSDVDFEVVSVSGLLSLTYH